MVKHIYYYTYYIYDIHIDNIKVTKNNINKYIILVTCYVYDRELSVIFSLYALYSML